MILLLWDIAPGPAKSSKQVDNGGNMKFFLFFLVASFVVPCWVMAEDDGDRSEITIYSGLSFLDAEIERPGCAICGFPVSPIPFFGSTQSIDSSFMLGFQYG